MKPNGIVFHWTAGRYNQTFDDYHYNVTYDPKTKKAKKVVTCESDEEMKYHSWPSKSCTGTIGISACCMLNATEDNWGECPITEAQIEMMAAIAGEKVKEYGIPYDEIYTHATWATCFDYGPGSGDPETRWDLWIPNWKGTGKNLSQYIVDKTIWYAENAGKKNEPVTQKKIPYEDLIRKYSSLNNLRFAFVAGVIEKESSFKPGAVSISDAKGLMQLKQGTFNQHSSGDIFDPSNNIRAGCSYLAWLKNFFGIDKADNSKPVELLISAAYNQGQNSPGMQYARKVQELSGKY
jgi:soluble lytic murein transglycosylase-like protein